MSFREPRPPFGWAIIIVLALTAIVLLLWSVTDPVSPAEHDETITVPLPSPQPNSSPTPRKERDRDRPANDLRVVAG
jgi:hypothetical protein